MEGFSYKHEMCSCTRDQVIFYCDDNKCPNHDTQRVYCFLCADKAQNKHLHESSLITELIKKEKDEWTNFAKKAAEEFTKAKELQKDYGQIIEIAERSMEEIKVPKSKKSMKEDFQTLTA